jgi:hypothetical protein
VQSVYANKNREKIASIGEEVHRLIWDDATPVRSAKGFVNAGKAIHRAIRRALPFIPEDYWTFFEGLEREFTGEIVKLQRDAQARRLHAKPERCPDQPPRLTKREFRTGALLLGEAHMRFRFLGFVMSAYLCGALLAGCAGGGSSAARSAGILPANANSAGAPAPRGGVRRTSSVPSCSGTGTGAFVGGGFENVADGAYSGVLEGNSNEVCDEESSVAGGYYNFISSGANTSYYSFIGSGYDNSISSNGYQSVIGGGNVNSLTAPNSVIGGGNQNTLSGGDSVIAGGSQNTVSSVASYAAIAGGSTNILSAQYGFIGAGLNNTVSGQYGVIGGGSGSALSGPYGVIAGGDSNNVTNTYGFIGAGRGNVVTGEGGVIGGGYANAVRASWATVPGGYGNAATGLASFAAGTHSNAATTGAFVWSDDASGATLLESTVANQFLARASGGVTFWTNATNTVGATLAAGSGTWASASDRALKTDVARIDDAAVLEKVAGLPISRWSYVSERGVRHVGPMAQDFYAAFGVGEDDKHITSIDEDGVALAAIKALRTENLRLRAQQARLQAVTASQSTQIALMRRQLLRVSAAVSALGERRE